MTALREIKLLRELHHPRLVQLFDVFSHKANLFLVPPVLTAGLSLVLVHELSATLQQGALTRFQDMGLS